MAAIAAVAAMIAALVLVAENLGVEEGEDVVVAGRGLSCAALDE